MVLFQNHIAIPKLVRYMLEGELPYRPYFGVLHLNKNRCSVALRHL